MITREDALSITKDNVIKKQINWIYDSIGTCRECEYAKRSRNINIVRCSILNEQIKKSTGFCDEFEKE
jgi:hypothetical protein